LRFSFKYNNKCQRFGSECGSSNNYKVFGVKGDITYPACISSIKPEHAGGSQGGGIENNECPPDTQYSPARQLCVIVSPTLTVDGPVGWVGCFSF